MAIPKLKTFRFGFTLAVVVASISQLNAFQPHFQRSLTYESSAFSQGRRICNNDFSPFTALTTFHSPSCLSIRTSTQLFENKLWDRLQIEEDPEPFWYLINCVAGLEIDLLRQCRDVCQDMPDAIKFVVPVETKTRSHGANRMVTEKKVKYQGYVFAKLRLCPEVYEAIQGLDLCRSWMGTVNHKGHKKLPPSPVALNELEVENFGLENLEYEEEERRGVSDEEQGVILDEAEEVDATKDMVDQEALKVFLGLKVDDMVKVTKKCKFFDEDAIVRRLKDGKILLRFYTYGSMFEEWMDPGDVRKLSEIEVLKGLSGPTQPMTQRDIDGPDERSGANRRSAQSFRGDLMSNFRGDGGPRNRRQDRVGRGQSALNKRDFFSRTEDEKRREERNWDWYKERRRGKEGVVADDEWSYRPGSGEKQHISGEDDSSQWTGPPSQRQQRKERNARQQYPLKKTDDWSSLVSPTSAPAPTSGSSNDDFFSSLMQDLSQDLGPTASGSHKQHAGNKQTTEDDDFFESLMAEISVEDEPMKSGDSSMFADDFFAALDEDNSINGENVEKKSVFDEDELFDSFDMLDSDDGESEHKAKRRLKTDETKEEDFFVSLEAELGDTMTSSEVNGETDSKGDEDFFAALENEISSALDGDVASDSTSGRRSKQTTDKPSESKPGSSATELNDLKTLTVPVLKEMLRARGLKVSGKKAELIERLRE